MHQYIEISSRVYSQTKSVTLNPSNSNFFVFLAFCNISLKRTNQKVAENSSWLERLLVCLCFHPVFHIHDEIGPTASTTSRPNHWLNCRIYQIGSSQSILNLVTVPNNPWMIHGICIIELLIRLMTLESHRLLKLTTLLMECDHFNF